jgi:hypothetical protein
MDYDNAVRTEAENVLMSLGGVKLAKNAFTWFELDFDPTTAIQDIGIALMRVTPRFIPVNSGYEEVIETRLSEQERSFVK